jgi:hypothetical protein
MELLSLLLAPLPAPMLAPLSPLPDNAEYPDQAVAKAALQAYDRAYGCSILVKLSRPQHTVYNYSKGGKYRDKGKNL